MNNWTRSRLIFFCILAYLCAAFQSSPAPTPDSSSLYIVLLQQPSVVERVLEWLPEGSIEERQRSLRSPQARSYQEEVESRQGRLMEFLHSRRMEVLERRSFLLNLLLVRATEEAISELEGNDEVRGVYPNQERFPLMDAAPNVVGAPALWSALGGVENAGARVKIAIVDSGIAAVHPMFASDGLMAPAGFPLPAEFSAHTNNKVIVARTYVSSQYGLAEQDNKTPEDETGHGSQVAGVAAGRQVSAPLGQIQGIAPLAFLGNYKVFGSPEINGSTTSAAVIAALNDAVSDGMNVVNLSLGGSARDPSSDPEQLAIANATAVGVVVVVAAGNSGPQPGTVTSPGTSPAAITVGASTNSRVFASALDISSSSQLPADLKTIVYVPGTGAPITTPAGPMPIVSISSHDASEEACSALPAGSLAGQAALVRRGSCLFADKATHVFNAGASAMVVYNNVEGSAVGMLGLNKFTQPAVMIEKQKGEALRDFLRQAQADVTIRAQTDLAPFPSAPDLVTRFSARGPNINLEIKPDLAAPGQNIHTASRVVTPEPKYTSSVSGTSFSTPMVAGAAALLKQLHAGWPAAAIKSALVNTAHKRLIWNDQPARVIQGGNGRLDLEQAMRAASMLDPVSVSFGVIAQEGTERIDRTIKLTNLSARSQTYQIEVAPAFENRSVSLSVSPATLTLAGDQTAELVVTAQLTAPLAGGAFEGSIRVESSEPAAAVLTAAFWGGITVEEAKVLEVAQSGAGAFSDLSAALEAAHAGNTIEIIDSGTYRSLLTIRHNGEGLPLDGLTIRSAPGASPTLDVRGLTTTSAAITVSGRKRVTIQGLRIQGGFSGIRLQNSTATIRGNTIEETVDRSASYGISLSGSRAHIFENRIQSNPRTGIAVFASSALIQQNRLTANAEHGIFASTGSSLALFDNELSENGGGAGGQAIRISGTPALLKGNAMKGSKGNLADGVLARGPLAKVVMRDNRVESNGRMGVSLFEGAEALLVRNQIRDNQDTGLYLEEGSKSEVRAGTLTGNARAVQSLGSTLLVSDSLLANSSGSEGDGILARDGVLNVFNSTLTGNKRFGINLANATANVYNSILYQNVQGDLSGTSGAAVSSNLIGDGQLAGSSDNFAADPLFTDPQQLDFSLKSGSPAIDRGDSRFPVSAEDLLFHSRTVDGDGDGAAQVDLGAIEFASSSAPPLILPVLSTKSTEFVGLALANAFNKPAAVLLRLYNPRGELLGSYSKSIDAGSQFALLLTEAFNPLAEGWVEIRSSTPDLLSFTLLGNFSLTSMDGAELSGPVGRKLILPEVRSGAGEQTWLYVINPHEAPLSLTFRWIQPDGPTILMERPLPAKGMLASTFADLFGTASSGASAGGYLLVEAEKPIFGLELFGSERSRGGLLALDFEGAASTLYAAQLASGSGLDTTLNLINTGPATDVTLEALDEAGKVMDSVTLKALASGAQYRRKAREIFSLPSSTVVGWMRARAGTGTLSGSISFGDDQGGFLASLPLQSQGAREFLLSHVAQTPEIFTGITLLNASSTPALVSLEVFDREKKRTGLALAEIEGGQKKARLLSEWVPGFGNQSSGFIRIRSQIPLFAFELFGNNSLDFLSAVPQQSVVR